MIKIGEKEYPPIGFLPPSLIKRIEALENGGGGSVDLSALNEAGV
jgi:hypothetical protein